MTLADNPQLILNMPLGLSQRQEMIRQIVNQLQGDSVWRSPDGKLAVSMTDAQRTDIEAFITAYLDESEILIAAARAQLAPLPGGAGVAP